MLRQWQAFQPEREREPELGAKAPPNRGSGTAAIKDATKWNEFLNDSEYNFRFIANLSGTPYRDDEYATDVMYRYDIMDAMVGAKTNKMIIKM